jgi:hypothetical protein
LLGVHSRYDLYTRTVTVFRDSFTEGFNRFVTSTVAPVASGWSISPGGTSTHWKAPPFHGAPPKRPFSAYSWGVDSRNVKSLAFFRPLIAITVIVAAAL